MSHESDTAKCHDRQAVHFVVLVSTGEKTKADSTLRSSQAVPHPSTDRARSRRISATVILEAHF